MYIYMYEHVYEYILTQMYFNIVVYTCMYRNINSLYRILIISKAYQII